MSCGHLICALRRETPLGRVALSVPTPKADVSSAVTLGSYVELESRLFPLLQHLRGAGSARGGCS